VCVAGCGDKSRAPATPSILEGPVQNVGFAQVRQAIDRLYAGHPDIESFVSRQVEYTPKTRDNVLRVCSKGGPDVGLRELESSRVFACAPLIFFFYGYGTQKSVPESVDVARKLYWYTVTHNQRPYDSRPVLTPLLRTWGIK
jgi:hypothetical protein